jgi:retrotransposon gag protein
MPPGGGGGGPTGPSSPSNAGGPRGPGGPPGGGEGPNLPAGGNPAAGGQPPSDKTWRSLLNHFDSTRLKADDFIDKLKSYFHVNRLNAALQSPITNAAFALTLIKGPEVAGWVRDMGEFLDNLDPTTDDVPEVWEQFLNNFAERFQDSTCENQAQWELKGLTLKFPFIDEYTSKFEELARQANYMARNPEMWQMFLKGLPCNILEDVIKAGAPPTYQDLKQQTADMVRAHQTIDNILKWRNMMTSAPSTLFCPNNFRGRPFYWGNQCYNNRQSRGQPRQPWNFSTTPKNMNNMPVPMDIDRARAYRGQGFQGRVATLNEPGGPKSHNRQGQGGPSNVPRGPCFECSQMGHFTRNCP